MVVAAPVVVVVVVGTPGGAGCPAAAVAIASRRTTPAQPPATSNPARLRADHLPLLADFTAFLPATRPVLAITHAPARDYGTMKHRALLRSTSSSFRSL